MKYYFEKGDEDGLCYTREHFNFLMEERGITEIEVYPAKVMYGTGYFYCQEHGEMGEVSEGGCGKFCNFYKPRNGKNGRCKHSSSPYEPSELPIVLKYKK